MKGISQGAVVSTNNLLFLGIFLVPSRLVHQGQGLSTTARCRWVPWERAECCLLARWDLVEWNSLQKAGDALETQRHWGRIDAEGWVLW